MVSTMTLLGDALRLSGRRKEAIDAYRTALQLEPDDAHSAARLAELYLLLGQVDNATALEPRIDKAYSPTIKAALRLAGNDRALLPAVTQISMSVPDPI